MRGLEPCLVLNEVREIATLADGPRASIRMRVARPAALLVAKAYKIGERIADGGERARPNDALDVLRLLQLGARPTLAVEFRALLTDPRCGDVAAQGGTYLGELFGKPNSPGCLLLRREYGAQGAVFAAQVHALASDLLNEP